MPKIKATPPVMLFIRDVHLLEHDAATQYRFNRFWAVLWGLAMVAVLFPLWPHTADKLVQLLILEVSLWANFATHFSGMSAALAAKNSTRAASHLADTIGTVQADIHTTADAVLPMLQSQHELYRTRTESDSDIRRPARV